jgi:hypothetical protein
MNIYHKSIESQDPNDDELAPELLKTYQGRARENEEKKKQHH